MLIGAMALVVAVAAGVTLGFIVFPPTARESRAPASGPAPPPSGADARRVSIRLEEFSIDPQQIEVPRGEEIAFSIFNGGDLQHDFKVDGEVGIERLEPGRNASFGYGPVEESVMAWCTIPGHREQGMEMEIVVTE
jgi:nitrite reductase (NO-forming)